MTTETSEEMREFWRSCNAILAATGQEETLRMEVVPYYEARLSVPDAIRGIRAVRDRWSAGNWREYRLVKTMRGGHLLR